MSDGANNAARVVESTWDQYVDDVWFYDPTMHGGMPEIGYTALGIAGEAGEVSEKIKKFYRDGHVDVDALMKEIGDVLFYATKLAHLYGYSLTDIKVLLRKKLDDRVARGTTRGSGDER